MKAASCWQTSRRVQYTMTERQSRKRGPFSSWMSATSLLGSRDTLSWRWSGSGVSRTTPCPSPDGTPSTPDTLSTVAVVAVAVRPSIVFTPNFSLSTCKDKITICRPFVYLCYSLLTAERNTFKRASWYWVDITWQTIRYEGRKLCDHWEMQWTSSMQANATGGRLRRSSLVLEFRVSGDTSRACRLLARKSAYTASFILDVWPACRQAIRRQLDPQNTWYTRYLNQHLTTHN